MSSLIPLDSILQEATAVSPCLEPPDWAWLSQMGGRICVIYGKRACEPMLRPPRYPKPMAVLGMGGGTQYSPTLLEKPLSGPGPQTLRTQPS